MAMFQFNRQTAFYRGKVRDVYTIGDRLLVMVASDRISAFDVVLPHPIPFKGQVLNQLAAFMLDACKDICPNWLLDVPAPHVSIGRKCSPFKIEMVIRGNLTGHAWRTYSSGKRELCGVHLPEGMNENDFFPAPIITPTTKAEQGHDEDISQEEIIRRGLVTKEQWEQLSAYALRLFERGRSIASRQNLILADTKYEFGHIDGVITLMDEIHTPVCSRYF
ncbi:MAG: phosphoribosylaminoimidazolesuccinocarboxamide synthase, partial [Ferruginibacter sp.]